MEYIIGGVVVLIVVLILKARAARTNIRNADPLQHQLLKALGDTIEGRMSERELDGVIKQVGEEARYSPHQVSGDTLQTRLAHAVSMAPMFYNDKHVLQAIKQLARQKSIEL